MDVYVSAHLGCRLDNSSRPGDFQSTYICALVIVLYRLYRDAALYSKSHLCVKSHVVRQRH